MKLFHPRSISLIVIAIAILFFGVPAMLLFWIITLSPTPTVDYTTDLIRLQQESRPSGATDAWPDLLNAIVLIDRAAAVAVGAEDPGDSIKEIFDPSTPGSARYGLLSGNPFVDFLAPLPSYDRKYVPGYDRQYGEVHDRVVEQTEDACDWIESNMRDDLVSRLADAQWADIPDYQLGPDDGIASVMMLHMGQFRYVANWLTLRMIQACARDDSAAAVLHYQAITGVSRAMYNQPLLNSRLVAIAIRNLALMHLRTCIMTQPLTVEMIDALVEAVEQRPPLPPLAYNLRAERIIAADAIQRTWTRSGIGGGMYLPAYYGWGSIVDESPPLPDRFANLRGLLAPTRNEMSALTTELWRDVGALPQLTMAELPSVQGIIDAHRTRLDSTAPNLASVDSFVFDPDVYPNLTEPIRSEHHHNLLARGVRLMLLLERHRIQIGAVPASLVDLPDGVVTPLDEAWIYRRTASENDPFGRGYLLYLPGDDGVDNRGSHGNSPMSYFTPAGEDWVLNWYPRWEDEVGAP